MSDRRAPDGCFWVSFAVGLIVSLACVGLFSTLVVAAIGWLERH